MDGRKDRAVWILVLGDLWPRLSQCAGLLPLLQQGVQAPGGPGVSLTGAGPRRLLLLSSSVLHRIGSGPLGLLEGGSHPPEWS